MSGIHQIGLFRALPPQDMHELARQLVIQTMPPRTMLIDENESSTEIYFVLDGRVAVKSFSSTGHEVAYAEFGAGECFGEFAALDGKPRSASVETLTPVRLASMEAGQFRACLLQYPSVAAELSRTLVGKIRLLTERIFEFSTLPVPIRVRLELLRLARRAACVDDRCVIEAAPSHQSIAAYIATHREAVSREISALVQAGVLETQKRTLIICSLSRLRTLAGLIADRGMAAD